MISGFYAAVFVFIQIFLILSIVRLRWAKRVSLGDGGDEILNRQMRAHGNFVESVPMALFLMLIAELSGAPLWSIHLMGVVMVVGRISHAIGLTTGSGHGRFRMFGMILTFVVYILGAVLCIWLSLALLFSR